MPRPAATKAVPTDPEAAPDKSRRVVSVDYEGHTYTYDADTVTIDALEDLEQQRYIQAIRAILGQEQWAAYKTRHPRAVDLDRFLAALLSAAADVGNSSASSAS